MKTKDEPGNRQITFREETACPYFDDGRAATIEYVLAGEDQIPGFHIFLGKGYRRFGRVFYRTDCAGCSSCIPIRIEAEKFRPSRSQKRATKKCSSIVVALRPSAVTEAKIQLYGRYLSSKHGEKAKSREDLTGMLSAIHYGYDSTIEMDYYEGDRLIAVGVVDAGEDCLSANYFYYDTSRLEIRPGVISILEEISLALRLGKKYYYLGFLVDENPKMSYKKYFRPNEIYREGVWKPFPGKTRDTSHISGC